MKKQLLVGFSILLTLIVTVTLAVLFSTANKNHDETTQEGGLGTGASCASTGICISDVPSTVMPEPGPVSIPEKVTTGGECVGICIQNDSTFSLPLNSGVIGEWIEEEDGTLVTKYSSCEDIWVVDERTKSLKFVCETNDTLVHFNGDNDTYRIAESISDGKITWSSANPLPKVYTSEGSGELSLDK